jgi:hypothetical protein
VKHSSFSDDDLVTVLREDSSRDARREALMRILAASWEDGWQACEKTYKEALVEAAVRIGPHVKEGRA